MADKKPLKTTYNALKGPVKRTPSSIAKPSDTRYVVKGGDTLAKIAKANGTTVSSILKINPSLRTNPKYQGGNVIFRGTRVRLK